MEEWDRADAKEKMRANLDYLLELRRDHCQKLIAAGHDQTHVALVSSDHLRYVASLITEKTKHMYQVKLGYCYCY